MCISPQEIASDRGSPLYRIEDLLLTSERRYDAGKEDRDVDELNQDIGKAIPFIANILMRTSCIHIRIY